MAILRNLTIIPLCIVVMRWKGLWEGVNYKGDYIMDKDTKRFVEMHNKLVDNTENPAVYSYTRSSLRPIAITWLLLRL